MVAHLNEKAENRMELDNMTEPEKRIHRKIMGLFANLRNRKHVERAGEPNEQEIQDMLEQWKACSPSRPVRAYCSCCGKQAVKSWKPDRCDDRCTTMEGAVADFPPNVICGYCAEDLDENGLFPEEAAQADTSK